MPYGIALVYLRKSVFGMASLQIYPEGGFFIIW